MTSQGRDGVTHWHGDGHDHQPQEPEQGAAGETADPQLHINCDWPESECVCGGETAAEMRYALRAATLRAERAESALEVERERTEQVLLGIRDVAGRVCAEYEICEHVACNSAYAAFALADEALRTAAPAASGDAHAASTEEAE